MMSFWFILFQYFVWISFQEINKSYVYQNEVQFSVFHSRRLLLVFSYSYSKNLQVKSFFISFWYLQRKILAKEPIFSQNLAKINFCSKLRRLCQSNQLIFRLGLWTFPLRSDRAIPTAWFLLGIVKLIWVFLIYLLKTISHNFQ